MSQAADVRDELLALLRCPRTGEPLVQASSEQLATINAAMEIGDFRTSDGERITGPWNGAVVAEESSIYYRVALGVVTLLPDQGGVVLTPSSKSPADPQGRP